MAKRRRAAQRQIAHETPRHVDSTSKREFTMWIALGLIGLDVGIYASVWRSDFVRFDDPDYVTRNPEVTAGLTWHGIKWAFTTGHAANWHPLTWLSHMIDAQLFGLSAGPHHLTGLLLHALNTVLLFTVLHRMTSSVWRSAFVAALFAAHPLHVESVAWVSERKDVLSTCFFLLTVLAYAAYVQHAKARRYALVLFLFALGLMAKPMVVTLPFVLLLLDVWPLRRIALWPDSRTRATTGSGTTTMRLLLEKLPLLGLAAASSVVTLIVQRRGGAVGSLSVYPLALRLENAIVNYAAYIAKMFWPRPLSAFYPYRQSVSGLTVAGAAVLLVVVTTAVVRGARARPYLLVGWFWYLATLSPVVGLVQTGVQSMADRYTYIPLIGLFIIVAWGAADLAERWIPERVVPVTAVLAVTACAIVARTQTETWRNSLALWQHAVDVTSNNAFAQYNLGVVLVEAGRRDDGIQRFREAIRIDPDYADVHIDLANALNERGATDEAVAEFATVVRLRPDYADAHLVFGNLLRARGRTSEAITQYRQALRLDPTLASAHNELGNALTDEGKFNDALGEYEQAVRLSPGFAEAHNNVGAALARAGKSEEAIREFLEALRLKPGDATFHYNAAMMLEGAGRTKEALEHLRAALQTNPQLDAARRAMDRLTGGRARE